MVTKVESEIAENVGNGLNIATGLELPQVPRVERRGVRRLVNDRPADVRDQNSIVLAARKRWSGHTTANTSGIHPEDMNPIRLERWNRQATKIDIRIVFEPDSFPAPRTTRQRHGEADPAFTRVRGENVVLPVHASNPQLLDERPHPGQRADLNVRTTGFRVRRRQTLTSTSSQLLLGPPNEWALQRTCGGRRRYRRR